MTRSGTPIAAVLLAPGEASHLPAVFAHWLGVTGRPGRYVPLYVEAQDLGDVIQTLPKAGFVGVHVSPVYQKSILDFADIITDRAALMSAANTVIFRKDGKIHADNTDGYGFIENIRQNAPGWNPKSGPAAVYGAGRSAREIIAALLEVGVEEIRVASRTRPRADTLRNEFGTRIKVFDWLQAGNIVDGAHVVTNCTPLGSEGHADFRVPLDALVPGAVVCDLVIDPPVTRFLRVAMEAGCNPVDGVGMLLCQAAPSFERWFGERPVVDDAARAAAMDIIQ